MKSLNKNPRKSIFVTFSTFVLCLFPIFPVHGTMNFLKNIPKEELQSMLIEAWEEGYKKKKKEKSCPDMYGHNSHSLAEKLDIANLLKTIDEIAQDQNQRANHKKLGRKILLNGKKIPLKEPPSLKLNFKSKLDLGPFSKQLGQPLPEQTSSSYKNVSMKMPVENDRSQNILYFTEKLRDLFEVIFIDGLMCWKYAWDHGKVKEPVSADLASFVSREGRHYVMPHEDFDRYLAPLMKEKGISIGFKHSSFFAGEDVDMAGETEGHEGKMNFLDNFSGHYRPEEGDFEQFVRTIKKQGADLGGTRVVPLDDIDIRLRMFNLSKEEVRKYEKQTGHQVNYYDDYQLRDVMEWNERRPFKFDQLDNANSQGASTSQDSTKDI